jgi:hypothetical protein
MNNSINYRHHHSQMYQRWHRAFTRVSQIWDRLEGLKDQMPFSQYNSHYVKILLAAVMLAAFTQAYVIQLENAAPTEKSGRGL